MKEKAYLWLISMIYSFNTLSSLTLKFDSSEIYNLLTHSKFSNLQPPLLVLVPTFVNNQSL